ncbi:MAG: aminoacyl-tRNA hydrolase [Pirellulales bacterium]|nr:aminoacyl-tRNA hydrolase [Pirellulales bacterium]
MKLIVGLGNPGRKYGRTRHNVGFEVVDELARRLAAGRKKYQFDGEVVETRLGNHRLLLLWPQTYMNHSGVSVRQAVSFYRIDLVDILIVCDDFNLPLARLRFRPHGSDGGQKGLGDILCQLGTQEIARLRIGVGPLPPGWDAAGYVLSRFKKREREEMDSAVLRAADAVQRWIETDINVCMNEFNALE